VATEDNLRRQRSHVLAGFGTAAQAWNFTYGSNDQGSCAVNIWLCWAYPPHPLHDPKKEFRDEPAITVAPRTSTFADSVWIFVAPSSTDVPSRHLFDGGSAYGLRRLICGRRRRASRFSQGKGRVVPANSRYSNQQERNFSSGCSRRRSVQWKTRNAMRLRLFARHDQGSSERNAVHAAIQLTPFYFDCF